MKYITRYKQYSQTQFNYSLSPRTSSEYLENSASTCLELEY